MAYSDALITIIQDRVNNLENTKNNYEDEFRDSVIEEIASLEAILNILASLD